MACKLLVKPICAAIGLRKENSHVVKGETGIDTLDYLSWFSFTFVFSVSVQAYSWCCFIYFIFMSFNALISCFFFSRYALVEICRSHNEY